VLTPGPTLNKPARRATLDNVAIDHSEVLVWDFGWSEVPGATRYHLYGSGSNPTSPFLNFTLTSTSYRHETKGYVSDQNRMGWRWKVRALVNGIWSDWSEERRFDVAPLENKKAGSPKK
jgi:hypothetical protein